MKTPVKKEIVQAREDYLQEQVICLAEDIVDLNEWKDETAGNLNSMVENLNYNFDAITHNNENRKKEIAELDNRIHKFDDDSTWILAILVIWNLVLTTFAIINVL